MYKRQIAHSLLLKLLQDMYTTREESFVGLPAFARPAVRGGWGRWSQTLGQHVASDTGNVSLATDSDASQNLEGAGPHGGASGDVSQHAPLGGVDEEEAAALKEEEEIEVSTTRLNHRYAGNVGVHSPHRHVRTRLYITSESHIHSLLNVLRYCNLEAGREPRRSVGNAAASSNDAPVSPNGKVAPQTGADPTPPSLLSRRVETLAASHSRHAGSVEDIMQKVRRCGHAASCHQRFCAFLSAPQPDHRSTLSRLSLIHI